MKMPIQNCIVNKFFIVFCLALFFIILGFPGNANAALGIVGSYTHPNMQGAWNSTISGNYAYVTAPTVDCLTILDITTVTAPNYVGSICDGTVLNEAYSVFVYGNYAYVASRAANTLSVINISNPAVPFIAGFVNDAVNLNTPVGVFVSGNYAFVTARYQNRLTAVDISNPTAPIVVSSIQRNAELCGAWDVKIVDNLAYVTARGAGVGCPAGEGNRLTIIDISNPLSMVYMGSVKDDEQLNVAYGVDVTGNYAYVTSRGTGPSTLQGDRLTIVNVSNPLNPIITGSIKDGNLLNGAKGVKVFGFMAYVSAYDSNTLTLVNVSNPANPVISDSLTDPVNLSMPYGLSFRSGYSYVSSEGSSKFSIISGIPDTINPTLTSEAWRADLAGVNVANGAVVNYLDIDQPAEKITIYSTASDDSGLIVDHKIRYWKNGVLQPVSSWATGGLHQLAINGPLTPGDLIEYQSEATDGAGNVSLDPVAGRYSFSVSLAPVPLCCPPSGNCTITQNPCNLGGSFINVAIDVNVNTASPLNIILTSDLSLSNTDFDFRNKFVGANTEVTIDGKATAALGARNVDMNGGSIYYPLGGLTIDLSVPDALNGNGGTLDLSGTSGFSTFPGGSNLIIYTQGSGSGKRGGDVTARFTSDTLFGSSSTIKTGNISMAGVDGGNVALIGGSVGIEGSVNLISTSSSRLAGNVTMTSSGYYKGGIHANSCEGYAGCGLSGGATIDLTHVNKFYVPDCTSVSLEAKHEGTITWQGTGFLDLPGTTTTNPSGTLKLQGTTVSDCSCVAGSCRTQLEANNSIVNFIGVDCGSDPLASCPGSGAALPVVQFSLTSSSGAENVTPANLQVSLSAVSSSDVTVNYSVTGGTATGGGVDYTLANGTLTIPAGSLNANIPVSVVDDASVEPGETIIVTLSNPGNASLGASTVHTYTINNNDNCVGGVAVTSIPKPLSISAGNSGIVNIRLISTSSCDDTVDVTINTTGIVPASAIDLSWFDQTFIAVPVLAGQTVNVPFTITVPFNAPGGFKTFKNNAYSNIFNATSIDTGVVSVASPEVSFLAVSSSGAESVTAVNLELSLSRAISSNVTVNYSITGGTATGGGVDYTLANGTATIVAGSLNTNIPITIINDLLSEPDETINITLAAPITNATLGANLTYIYTIINNDIAPLSTCPGVSIVNFDGNEYGNVKIGNQCWMDRNINRGTMITAPMDIPLTAGSEQSNDGIMEKYCYNNLAGNCDDPSTNPQIGNPYPDGGLYQWAEAMQLPSSCNTTDCAGSITFPRQGICPLGWHIPQKCEFEKMNGYLNSTYPVTGEEELREGGLSGFNAPWTGSYTHGARFFDRSAVPLEGDNKLWSSTQKGALVGDTVEATAYTKYLYDGGAGNPGDNNGKLDGNSVRCVLDTFDYDLSNSGNITITQGNSGASTITAILTFGATQAVNFIPANVTGLPADAIASFSSAVCNPTCSTTLTIATAVSTPVGTYPITVTGSSAEAICDKSTTFDLVVDTFVPSFIPAAANVMGFAWSENIGWVSFNNRNCDTNNDGYSEAALLGCPAVGTFMQGYGVNLNPDVTLSGFAWSDNIGWISFNWNAIKDSLPFECPYGSGDANCQAKLIGTNLTGWARACSVFEAGCFGALKPDSETGGWNGWINLRKDIGDMTKGVSMGSWSYIQKVASTNLGAVQNNYQISIMLDTASLISAGKMQANCQDIRFTDSDKNTLLPYWIESGCNTSDTKIWIKAALLANPSTDIYLYYGNPAAIAASDYDSTFTKNYNESGLVGLWHMDEGSGLVIADSSGSGHSGVMGGAPFAPAWVGSDGGQWDSQNIQFSTGDSLNFDGIDDYVSVMPNDTFDGLAVGTYMAWVKKRAGATGWDSLFTADSGNCTNAFEIALSETGGVSYFEVWTGSPVTCYPKTFNGYIPIANPTAWHLVTYVVSGAGNEFYLDGVKQTATYEVGNASSTFFFSQTSSGTTRYFIGNSAIFGTEHAGEVFDGQMDEVRIYNRVLSAAEINRYYLRSKYASPAPAVSLVVGYGVSLLGTDFTGWAWGSDVAGWLSFNSKNCDIDANNFIDAGVCGGNNTTTSVHAYKVYLEGALNTPPNIFIPAVSPAVPNYCVPPGVAGVRFYWNYTDIEDLNVQTKYQLIITREDGVVYDSGIKTSPATDVTGTAINNDAGKCNPGPDCTGFIDYGVHTYSWTVQAWDSGNLFDGPKAGSLFGPTPTHRYPDVDFSPPLPATLSTTIPIQFCTDSVGPDGVGPICSSNTNITTCYDVNNVQEICPAWLWNFGDQAITPFDPLEDIKANPVHVYTNPGSYNIVLQATDSSGNSCSNLDSFNQKILGSVRPKWREVSPKQ